MHCSVQIMEFQNCRKFIWSIWLMKVELNNIFKLGNFHNIKLFNYWIGVNHAEAMWNCGHLPIFSYSFCKLRQLNYKNWKIGEFSTLIWRQLKMLNWFQFWFGIWKSSVIWSLKFNFFALFNNLFWCDSKNVKLKLKFCSNNWTSFLFRYFELILLKRI